MDDFNIISLRESRNEWCTRLINILTPKISEGIVSIFASARKLCIDNNEPEKYLLTFQNLLTRIPQWNPEIIKEETTRILTTGNCKYLEDLITCVHIIQLKILTYVRVGTKHKKIDLNIPKLNDFIHKIYILIARVIYQKAYLYSLEINTLERQKNNSIIETIIQECIMNAIRDSIPYELIVRSYLDETDEICEDIKEEIIKEKVSSPFTGGSGSVGSSEVGNNKTIDNTNKVYKSTTPLTAIPTSELPNNALDLIKQTLPTTPTTTTIPDSISSNTPIISPTTTTPTTLNNSIDNYLSEILTPIPTTTTNSVENSTKLFTLDNNNNIVNDTFNNNILFDNLNSTKQTTTPTISSSQNININKNNSLIDDDMDLLLCDIPTKINEIPIEPSLDYIELN